MTDRNKTSFDDEKRQLSSYAKYSGLAFQMVAIIGIFAFAGYKADIWLQHEVKWITALSCLLGVFLSLFQIIRQVNK